MNIYYFDMWFEELMILNWGIYGCWLGIWMYEFFEVVILMLKWLNGKIFEGLDFDLYVCKLFVCLFFVVVDMVCGVVVLKFF